MSSFLCPKCMTVIIDTPEGYTTECPHYPFEKKCTCSFEALLEQGFPQGSFTHSKKCPRYNSDDAKNVENL